MYLPHSYLIAVGRLVFIPNEILFPHRQRINLQLRLHHQLPFPLRIQPAIPPPPPSTLPPAMRIDRPNYYPTRLNFHTKQIKNRGEIWHSDPTTMTWNRKQITKDYNKQRIKTLIWICETLIQTALDLKIPYRILRFGNTISFLFWLWVCERRSIYRERERVEREGESWEIVSRVLWISLFCGYIFQNDVLVILCFQLFFFPFSKMRFRK
jgi:hypothetical protein